MAKSTGRKTLWVTSMIGLVVVLVGSLYLWQNSEAQNKVLRQEVFQLHDQVDSLEKELISLKENSEANQAGHQVIDQTAIGSANRILAAIQAKDSEAWADLVHPDQGVRFSAYGYVNEEQDRVLTPSQLRTAFTDTTSYTWGVYDGSGEPITADFLSYYQRFIYDVDFMAAPEVALNHVLGHGNTINNIKDVYPDAVFVEYYFAGFDPQYGGMDWRSLRLVLEQQDGVWYLVGVVHDEWTT